MNAPSRPQAGLAARFPAGALPFLSSLRSYTLRDFRADLPAALTVAIVASPQSMAYAVIAGVPPVYGLYASVLPVIVAALWGSSRYLLAGPTNALSMILFTTMSQLSIAGVAVMSLPEGERLACLFALTLLAGVVQLGMGLARLGDLSNFISHSVIQAFTVGASVLIVIGQMRSLLGLDFAPGPGVFGQLALTWEHLPRTNFWCLGTGLATLALAVLIKKIRPRRPNALPALVTVTAFSALLDLGSRGVPLAGAIPPGLPPLSLPPNLGADGWNALFLPALSIAMLGAVETLAIARTLASQRGESVDGSQELIGQGLGNIAAGLTSGIAGCGSFGRSAVNFSAGARTRFAAVFSGLFTLASLLTLGPLLRFLPVPALSALLLLICWNMIDARAIRFTLRATRNDAVVWGVTLASILLLDLEKAVFIGVLLSLALFLRREAHPRVERMRLHMVGLDEEWLVACPFVEAFRLEGPLFFGAVSEMEKVLHGHENQCARIVILHMNRVHFMDATGAHALKDFLRRRGKRGVKTAICWSNPEVRDIIVRTGLSRGKFGCYLTGNMQGMSRLVTTLLLEACLCQECMGCIHGREAVAQIHPGGMIAECPPQTLLPDCAQSSPDLERPAKGSDTLDKPDSPTALLESFDEPGGPPGRTARPEDSPS